MTQGKRVEYFADSMKRGLKEKKYGVYIGFDWEDTELDEKRIESERWEEGAVNIPACWLDEKRIESCFCTPLR